MIQVLAFVALLFTASPSLAFTTTTCQYGETGTCRLAACTGTDINAAITASSSGGFGTMQSDGVTPRTSGFDGDAVYVQACSSTSVGTISWSNKNVSIRGQSNCTLDSDGLPTSCPTNLSGSFQINVTDAGSRRAAFKIGHMRFDTSGIFINYSGGNPHSTQAIAGYFRVHHILQTRTCGANAVQHYGVVYGLYDHLNVSMNACGNPYFQQSEYLNNEYNVAPTKFLGEWSALKYTPRGTINNVYVENSKFTHTSSSGLNPIRDSESGPGHFVFRYNTVTSAGAYVYFYAHWSRNNEWDGAWVEVYKNKMTCTNCGGYPFRLESGTGVIYDNQISGWTAMNVVVDEGRGCGGSNNPQMFDCNGSRAWDMNAGDTSAPGWPCASQIGVGCLVPGGCSRGGQDNVPLILWNNGAQVTCATGGACTDALAVSVVNQHGDAAETCVRPTSNYIKATPHTASVSKFNNAVDYCHGLSTKPATCGTYTNNYTAYSYPHPLQQAGGSSPSAPTNFRFGWLGRLLAVVLPTSSPLAVRMR